VFTVLKSKPALRFAKVVLVTVISVLLIIPILPAYATGSDERTDRTFFHDPEPATDEELAWMKTLNEMYNAGLTRTYRDTYFDYNLSDGNGRHTDSDIKENSTSFYLWAEIKEVSFVTIVAEGYNIEYSRWQGYTCNGAAYLYGTGEYEVYNLVWETLSAYNKKYYNLNYVDARMYFVKSAWSISYTVNGRFKGCYSPDCWGSFDILNP